MRKWRGYRIRRVVAAVLAAGTFAFLSMGADSCKSNNEKLQRDSKELEETSNKLERERGCEPNPPYKCPQP